MKGWLGDLLRTFWAMFYWNTRKTVFRLRGDRGTCPCQNPSDSGEPMQTGCEAIYGWRHAARFQRVCPLLRQNSAGLWVCSVRAQDVRPFWGRAVGYIGGTAGVVVLCGVLAVYGLMRGIGYEVTVRQIIWPPAWQELREVRAQLFIRKAREAYTAGRVREALNALVVAYEMNPANYRVGMMLAQFYQAGNPGLADSLYARLLREHPDHRVETARVWFRSLLARGRLRGIVELARRQLTAEPQQAPAWVHALVFASRHLQDPRPLESAAQSEKLPPAVRETLRLAARVQSLRPAEARDLLAVPTVSDFPYDRIYRIETLTRLGFADAAFELLLKSRGRITGRDMARLAFALYALKGDSARLDREFAALLAPSRELHPYELSLLAVHLVNWPDPALLDRVCEAFGRMASEPLEVQLETGLAVFCAAGVQRNLQRMTEVQRQMTQTTKIPLASMNRLSQYFMTDAGKLRIENLLPQQNSLSLELNYALLEKYLSKN